MLSSITVMFTIPGRLLSLPSCTVNVKLSSPWNVRNGWYSANPVVELKLVINPLDGPSDI